MTNDIEMDPETGLPVLPEGYRWFVNPHLIDSYGSGPGLSIQQKVEVESWWSKKYMWRDVYNTVFREGYTITVVNNVAEEVPKLVPIVTEEVIRNCAVPMYEDWIVRYEKNVLRSEALDKFVGAYPPKRIGKW